MGTIADKLNYSIASKKDVQEACIYQGVEISDTTPFGEYGKYIRLLKTAGGFDSFYEFTIIVDEDSNNYSLSINIFFLKHGVRKFKIFLDDVEVSSLFSSFPDNEEDYIILTHSIDGVIKKGIHKIKIKSLNQENNYYVSNISYLGNLWIYGYDLQLDNPNPDDRVSYPQEVDNYNYNPAYMDYSLNVFNYGSWPSKPGDKFMPKPCMLGLDGVVKEWLDPNDYTKTINGDISHISDKSFNANAMMEWKEIYTYREEIDGIYKFRCSNYKVDDNYECWCNYNKDNNKIKHFYTSIYNSCNILNKMYSLSNNNIIHNLSAEAYIDKMNEKDDGWYIEAFSDRMLIQDLLILMSKSTNSQTKFGNGNMDGPINFNTGAGDNKGLFWGKNDNTSVVKIFGMENWYGNLWRFVAGLINDNGILKIKITRGNKDGTMAFDYNLDGKGYITIPNSEPSGTSGAYISKTKITPYGRIPYSTVGGSKDTYETDGLFYVRTKGYGACGGASNVGYPVGSFYTLLHVPKNSPLSDGGAAISYK